MWTERVWNQGSNRGPPLWEYSILSTGPPGKSLHFILFILKSFHFTLEDSWLTMKSVSFRCTAKWFSYTDTCVYSFSSSLPFQFITKYWAEFPVLYRVIFFFCREIWVSMDNVSKGSNLSFQWNVEHCCHRSEYSHFTERSHQHRWHQVRSADKRLKWVSSLLVLSAFVLLASRVHALVDFLWPALDNPSHLLWSTNPCYGAFNCWHSSGLGLRFQL